MIIILLKMKDGMYEFDLGGGAYIKGFPDKRSARTRAGILAKNKDVVRTAVLDIRDGRELFKYSWPQQWAEIQAEHAATKPTKRKTKKAA